MHVTKILAHAKLSIVNPNEELRGDYVTISLKIVASQLFATSNEGFTNNALTTDNQLLKSFSVGLRILVHENRLGLDNTKSSLFQKYK